MVQPKQSIFNIAEICAQLGVQNFIVSPGSRSAPLTVAFGRHQALTCRVVMDERAAAFIALGLAQQTQQPVGLVCTSGTAGVNYGPAVIEAYYQRIPLLVFTADRPPEWIDQQDGQTIRQNDLYGGHLRGNFTLPTDTSHPDAQWHLERIISEAINAARWPIPGPVHINVPLREPLYPPPDSQPQAQPNRQLIRVSPPQATFSAETWAAWRAQWQSAERKLIVAGLSPADPQLSETLATLQNDESVVVIGDLAANIHQSGTPLHQWDMVLSTRSAERLEDLRPELLISFGGQIVSKSLKLFLRKYKPQAHWHIDPAGQAIDTFQSLTQVIATSAARFFSQIAQVDCKQSDQQSTHGYTATWRQLESTARQQLHTFLDDVPFGEFTAAQHVMAALPEGSYLQLGNSMPVRYANYIGLAGRQIVVNANRGTSGIDGTVSTTVGAAMATEAITTLITGDLAFFYDRNALWHNHIPQNLRIIILNNHGGGIFKLIDGPGNLPEAELTTYFKTPHHLTARRTAADYGCAYFHCDNASDLQKHLATFFKQDLGPAILEIETDSDSNTAIFQQFKSMMSQG